ncbi:hypothetical protein [Paenibacillus sp. M2]|uniref:hypothetical protein n=1 Tax=Paenibacillus sp. M2 TaxID=3341793 RepID=UPI00398A4E8B
MVNLNDPVHSEEAYPNRAANPPQKPFVLWRELIPAYLSPAIMASIGGIVTADKVLQLRALTTIGGASLLMALCAGLWLRNRENRPRWVTKAPRVIVVGCLALAGAGFGFVAAWGISNVLQIVNPSSSWAWLDHIGFDFPLSGAIACTIMSWRWRTYITK